MHTYTLTYKESHLIHIQAPAISVTNITNTCSSFSEEQPIGSDFCQWGRNLSDYLTGSEQTSQGALCVCASVYVSVFVQVLLSL